jgi:hypothetical protein
MAKTYTKTRVKATEAMLLISKADRILANDRLRLPSSWISSWDRRFSHNGLSETFA